MENLKHYLEKLNIPFTDDMIERFSAYMEGVLEWNEKINLTAITDKKEFVEKHFVDSVLCWNFNEYKNADTIIDVGTGAGFPGVPLAILSPDKDFILVDSLKKRLNVIDGLTAESGIENTVTVHGRAEELARNKKYREGFDVCVSRAVANLAVLCEYTLPFIKKGGHLLAYKGPDAQVELERASKAIKVLGGRFKEIKEVDLEGFKHNIVIIEKVKETPAKYPRKAGTPSKEPII